MKKYGQKFHWIGFDRGNLMCLDIMLLMVLKFCVEKLFIFYANILMLNLYDNNNAATLPINSILFKCPKNIPGQEKTINSE